MSNNVVNNKNLKNQLRFTEFFVIYKRHTILTFTPSNRGKKYFNNKFSKAVSKNLSEFTDF